MQKLLFAIVITLGSMFHASAVEPLTPTLPRPYHEFEIRLGLVKAGYDLLLDKLSDELEERRPRTDYYIDFLRVKGPKEGEFLNRKSAKLVKIRIKDKSTDDEDEFYYHASKRLSRKMIDSRGLAISITHLRNFSEGLEASDARRIKKLARKFLYAVHTQDPKAAKFRKDFDEAFFNLIPRLPGADELISPLKKKGKIVPIIVNTKKRHRMKLKLANFDLRLAVGETIYEVTPGVSSTAYELEVESFDIIRKKDAKKIARALGEYLFEKGLRPKHVRPEDGFNVCGYACERMATGLCKEFKAD